MSGTTPRDIALRDLRYGAAAFVLGVPTIPLFVLLPPYYAENLGLGLAATGLVLFFARMIDVFSDPIIGILSDRLQTPWGRYKPLITVGLGLGGIGTVWLLIPDKNAGLWYLGLWATVLYLGWTLISIPYLAWGAALAKDYQGRTRVTSIREGFTLLGILAAGAVPAIVASHGGDGQDTLMTVAWGTVAIGLILFSMLLIGVSEPTQQQISEARNNFTIRGLLADLFANKPFRLIIVCWLLNSLANGIPAVLFILFMKHVLIADEVVRGSLTLVYFLSGVIGIPLWIWLSAHRGKHRSWCAAMGLACIAFAFVPLLGAGDIIAFGVICIVTGIALGADLALPPSIQADVAEYHYFRFGRDASGSLFAAWSMVVKISFALSVVIAFPTLEALGFDPTQSTGDKNLFALAVIYSLLPIVFKLIAITIMWRYPLTAHKQGVIQQRMGDLKHRDSLRME